MPYHWLTMIEERIKSVRGRLDVAPGTSVEINELRTAMIDLTAAVDDLLDFVGTYCNNLDKERQVPAPATKTKSWWNLFK